MNISLRWLATFFPEGALDGIGAVEIADRLTAQGLAVDDVRTAFPGLDGVVLGRVVAAAAHPDADRLTLCTVDAGDGERQVVCGAPNVEVGALYGYARPGARLPDGREIRRAEIRGVTSEGMLCSAPELGLDALGDAEGIWRVPHREPLVPGAGFSEVLGLDDTILVVDVTSNRGDALSHLGVAREVQSFIGERLALPETKLVERDTPASDRVVIDVTDRTGCPVYRTRVIDEVTVGPSPLWLQLRLIAIGQRPISNVVDVTNFVMLSLGQPLHPFDLDSVEGGRVIVRRGEPGEHLRTLDDVDRALDEQMTVIADPGGAIAIGGVMGGGDSEVGDNTRAVLLESAHFDAASIQRTSRCLSLVTEASTRFARGVDPDMTGPAVDVASAMIAEITGGRVASGQVVSGVDIGRDDRTEITLRGRRLGAVIGVPIELDEARLFLEPLGFEIEPRSGDEVSVRAPSWRFDVHREADLIEEVARMIGYDRIPLAALPRPPIASDRSSHDRRVLEIREIARALGYDEAVTSSFVDADALADCTDDKPLLEIMNPISKEHRYLRPLLFATLGRAVVHNLNHRAESVRLFEIGHAFASRENGETLREDRRLALVVAGVRSPLDWSDVGSPAHDFFDLKGDVETILEQIGMTAVFEPATHDFLHPGQQAVVHDRDGRPIGFVGQVHPTVADAWSATEPIYAAELSLERLLKARAPLAVKPISTTPAITRDIALIVPDSDSSACVLSAIRDAGILHVEAIDVFDRYRGAQVAEGYYSLGVRIRFRADRTLTDEEVDEHVGRIIESLTAEREYRLR